MCGKIECSNPNRTVENHTALMLAAFNGHSKCVELLIEREARMQDSEGTTALMLAAKSGRKDCVNLLLKKEMGMFDSNGHNAKWYAAGECKETLAVEEECLCSNDLFDAAEKGCAECCRKFIG